MSFGRAKQRELVSFFSSLLGHYTHYPNQGEHIFDCPSCKRRRLSINFRKGVLHCWRCPEIAGSLRSYIKEWHPDYLPEYTQIVKGEADAEDFELFDVDEQDEEEAAEKAALELPQEFQPFEDNLYNDLARPYAQYLAGRGIDKLKALQYKGGYCASGAYQNRVVFPSYDRKGALNYYITRSIYEHMEPTYLNANAEKEAVIWYEDHFVEKCNRLVICEGIFDLLAVEEALGTDEYNYTLLLGKTLSEKSLLWDRILREKPDVYLALDPDAFQHAYNLAHILTYWSINVYIMRVPSPYKDFGEMMCMSDAIRECLQTMHKYVML